MLNTPDVSALSVQERIEEITKLRHKQFLHYSGKGEKLTMDELKLAAMLIQASRHNQAEARGKKSTAIVPADLSDF